MSKSRIIGMMTVKEAFALNNVEIRRSAKEAGVRLWQVAEAIGMQDSAFSRKLRKELPQEEKDRIFKIIKELSQESCK